MQRADAIGNLTADQQSNISNINWSVYGKILSISKTDGPDFTYTYYPDQKRATQLWNGITTYYVRDAQGNTLAIYDNKGGTVNWREQDLYGSSRLGMWTPNVNLANNNASTVWDTTGYKQYELTNHLGNVLVTITDKRIPYSPDGTNIAYYQPEVTTAQEYFAFGFAIPARNYTLNQLYRYGFNGKENDNQVKLDFDDNGIPGSQQDYGNRVYDPRVGRFLSVDPIFKQYPELSVYQFASNSPILNIDLDGLEGYGSMQSKHLDLLEDKIDKYFHHSTNITTIGVGAAGGDIYGGNVAIRSGTATDAIGITMFTAYSAVGPANQNLYDGSSNPKLILGGELGGDITYQNSNKPLFIMAFNSKSPSMSTVSGKFGLGGSATIGDGNFGLSLGFGIGGTFKNGNQSDLKSSFSITFKEDEKIMSKYAPFNYVDMRVINTSPLKDKNGVIIGYKGTLQVLSQGPFPERGQLNSEGWRTTDVQMTSGAMLNRNGKTGSDHIWQSNNYTQEAAQQPHN